MEKIGKIFVIKLYFRYPKSGKVVKSGVLHIFNSSQVQFLKKPQVIYTIFIRKKSFKQKNIILAEKNDSYTGYFENSFNSSDPNTPQKRLERLEKPLRLHPEPLNDP